MLQYQQIILNSTQNIERAERLKARGWKVINVNSGSNLVLFEKYIRSIPESNYYDYDI